MAHALPELGFSKDAVSFLSAETFDYHHGKHHNAYVTNLNKLLEGHDMANASLEELVKNTDGGLFNNATQHLNHSFYWRCIDPTGSNEPGSELATAIEGAFGSIQSFREQFTQKAATLFGSGWCWLVQDADGKLQIRQTGNAGCPITDGDAPLLTCDVWEHAYYVDFRNARPKYIEGFMDGINWDFVGKNFAALRAGEALDYGV